MANKRSNLLLLVLAALVALAGVALLASPKAAMAARALLDW